MSDAELPLGPSLEFISSLWELNHAMERLSMAMERRLGVTAQQRLLIRCVGRYPGVAAGALARRLHLDPGTISTTLGRLERRHLLTRSRDPKDGRRVSVALTAKGRRLDVRARGTVEAATDRLLEARPAVEIDQVREVLASLSALLAEELTAPENGATPSSGEPGPRATPRRKSARSTQ